jgi:hypothetical protein|tara:strand:+ start:3392 stop:3565 length:174 start_codon:yes stop_codon:yes gene_type:complete
MAKPQHPLEIAYSNFDETVKRHLSQVEKNFRNVKNIPEVKTPRKKRGVFETPFGGQI